MSSVYESEKLLPKIPSTSTDNEHFERDEFEIRGVLDEYSQVYKELQRMILDKYQNEEEPELSPRSGSPEVPSIRAEPSNIPFEIILRNERERYMKFLPINESKDHSNGSELLLHTANSLCKRLATRTELPKFRIYLNCKHFLPSELEVRIIDNHVVVCGSHSSKLDEHGLIDREFKSRYPIPEYVDQHSFMCHYNIYGILIIEATREETPRIVIIRNEIY
ncbi:alpha-crystallin A chain [Trichonephila clavata]|uniref:Alpha-crystallin A chain n=1 Tax=Trichonephila clavata TaxID=2740835 RepID=A0A8X6KN41_TRICU|nr:alpha-crystallin A chain [Trichonephila clavata]